MEVEEMAFRLNPQRVLAPAAYILRDTLYPVERYCDIARAYRENRYTDAQISAIGPDFAAAVADLNDRNAWASNYATQPKPQEQAHARAATTR